MTNFQFAAGSFIWSAIAAVLMLATFEPVTTQQPQELQLSAAHGAGAKRGSI